MMKTRKKDWWIPWAFLALPLTMYLLWVVFPVMQSFLYSLTHRDSILYGARYVGTANYQRLFSSSTFIMALKNNLLWLIAFVLFPVPVGLFIAMLFNNSLPGNRIYKTLFYLPMTLSFAVIGTIWVWMYHPDFGVVNTFLGAAGLDALKRQWLGDRNVMTFALIFVGLWRQTPYVMILYLAGLKNVPTEYVEAASVDGASWMQRFTKIIIPMLAPATIIAMTISVIDSLRAFDIIYVMTNTQARAAEVLATYMYSNAFQYYNFGYGSAIAVIQFLITFGFIILYLSNTMTKQENR